MHPLADKWLSTMVLVLAGTLCYASPGESDGGSRELPGRVELENIYWRLTRLGDEPVTPLQGRRETHLILRPDKGRAGGSDGCNRFFGGYRLEGDGIRFDALASTKMFCAEGMDTADAFHAALSEARSWKVQGGNLALYDASGRPLAQFEATHLE